MPGALLFFISFVVFQKRHRFLEKRLGGKILKPNIIYVFVKFKRERHSFLGLGFAWRIPEVGFKWNILLKGGYELGFEGIKG